MTDEEEEEEVEGPVECRSAVSTKGESMSESSNIAMVELRTFDDRWLVLSHQSQYSLNKDRKMACHLNKILLIMPINNLNMLPVDDNHKDF